MTAVLKSVEQDVPLVVDLDGTLIKTDVLVESLFRLIAAHPLKALGLPLWLVKGKSAFKARIAKYAALDLRTLPLNQELVAFLRTEKALGRRIYLASASDRRYVEPLAEHVGLFDGVFASDGQVNLRGRHKAERLCQEFGERGFDYAADAKVDLDVWRRARRVIAVNCPANVLRAVARRHPDHIVLGRREVRFYDYLRTVRIHQWAKNTLLFLPMLAAHAVTPANLGVLLLAFLSFSLTASSVYITNDLIDLPSDRDHATKRYRPLASGTVPVLHGLVLAPVLLLVGILLAAAVSLPFLGILLFYFLITTAYTLYLKRKAVVDVLILAGLYTLRVMAGAVALGLTLSPWMLAFSIFLFLCLALVKRYTELKARLDAGKDAPAGRGYRLDDMPLLVALAGASGYASVLVLALYVNSPQVMDLYGHPEGLWLACTLLLYWVSRVLLITHRGEMHDDPIVFALRDRVSLATIALTGAATVGSAVL